MIERFAGVRLSGMAWWRVVAVVGAVVFLVGLAAPVAAEPAVTAEEYKGAEGDKRCRLDGLSETNSNVRPRCIVIHQADYVKDGNVKPGRSWGCLAVSVANHSWVVNQLKEGSVILADRP